MHVGSSVRKVSIGWDQRAHLCQLNKDYTTQTVFYLRKFQTPVYHSDYNLIQFIRARCLLLFYAK